jgi:hypothetical protein
VPGEHGDAEARDLIGLHQLPQRDAKRRIALDLDRRERVLDACDALGLIRSAVEAAAAQATRRSALLLMTIQAFDGGRASAVAGQL